MLLIVDLDHVWDLIWPVVKLVFFGIPEGILWLLWGGRKAPVAAQVIGTLVFWTLVVGGVWFLFTTAAGAAEGG